MVLFVVILIAGVLAVGSSVSLYRNEVIRTASFAFYLISFFGYILIGMGIVPLIDSEVLYGGSLLAGWAFRIVVTSLVLTFATYAVAAFFVPVNRCRTKSGWLIRLTIADITDHQFRVKVSFPITSPMPFVPIVYTQVDIHELETRAVLMADGYVRRHMPGKSIVKITQGTGGFTFDIADPAAYIAGR